MKLHYVIKDDLLTFTESAGRDVMHDFEAVVVHTDHLDAVSQARADALRWVLGQLKYKSDWLHGLTCTRSAEELRDIIENELRNIDSAKEAVSEPTS